MAKTSQVKQFPVAFFSSVMGFAAFTIALQQAEQVIFEQKYISPVFLGITLFLFFLNGGILVYRLLKYRVEVQNEFRHPIQMNFFGTITISFSLIAVLLLPLHEGLSFTVWVMGAIFQLLLTIHILTAFMWNSTIEIKHLTPVTFIPIVGNLLVPLAGITHGAIWINWFYLGIGIFFSIVFMTLIFYRLFFHEPLPKPMRPTLFIFLAPPSVAFVAYETVFTELNHFSFFLYSIAFFIALFVLFQWKRILFVPFFVSWWSLLFPTAAFTIATLRMYATTGFTIFLWMCTFLFASLFAIAVYLLWQTISQFTSKKATHSI